MSTWLAHLVPTGKLMEQRIPGCDSQGHKDAV